VFTLWLRAVVESAGGIPPIVEQELDSRTPRLLGRVHRGVEAAMKNGDSAGARFGRMSAGGGERHLWRREAGRMVGCGPLLFFDVATFDEGVVTLGEH